MRDADAVTLNTGDFVMAKDGDYYVSYLDYGQAGDVRLDLSGHAGERYDVFWYNPRTGGPLLHAGTADGGSTVQLGGAPADPGKDWVLFVRNTALPDSPDSIPAPEPPPAPDPVPDPEPVPDGGSQYLDLFFARTDTDQTLLGFGDGSQIAASDLDDGPVTIYAVAKASAPTVTSVTLSVPGVNTQTEKVSPYALFGDTNGDFKGGTSFGVGDYDLSLQVNGTGGVLETVTLSFSVVEDSLLADTSTIVQDWDPFLV